MERPADVEEGFHQAAPLVFHYGHKSPNDNLQLYNMLVSRLAEIINVRSEQSSKGLSNVQKYPLFTQTYLFT